VPASVPRIRAEVVAFSERHARSRPAEVALAVTEACANVVRHAYRDGDSGEMRIVACARRDGLVVVVRDYGCGMRPHPDGAGLGLGIPLIGQLTRAFEIETPEEGGTRIRMRFPLPAGL
jgi:serine/threonine-protein kinase RsbW